MDAPVSACSKLLVSVLHHLVTATPSAGSRSVGLSSFNVCAPRRVSIGGQVVEGKKWLSTPFDIGKTISKDLVKEALIAKVSRDRCPAQLRIRNSSQYVHIPFEVLQAQPPLAPPVLRGVRVC